MAPLPLKKGLQSSCQDNKCYLSSSLFNLRLACNKKKKKVDTDLPFSSKTEALKSTLLFDFINKKKPPLLFISYLVHNHGYFKVAKKSDRKKICSRPPTHYYLDFILRIINRSTHTFEISLNDVTGWDWMSSYRNVCWSCIGTVLFFYKVLAIFRRVCSMKQH